MKAIFILCDTTNRRVLECYGAKYPAVTPNLNRLAKMGTVFDNHWCGSAPCMPARKDLLTGRLSFLEKPWGGIEPFDHTLPHILKEKNVHTQMFTDHSQYLICGGENYLNGFTAWDVTRGQEYDPWAVTPDEHGIRKEERPEHYRGNYSAVYAANRALIHGEEDNPSVITLNKAAAWLEDNHNADNYMLWVETFDPHEPYEVPAKYLDMYEDDYKGDELLWPIYEQNPFTEEETRHLNRRYRALLTMVDHHIGKLFQVMDEHQMWEDTMVIFTTDHGYMLGEHEYMGKNYMPAYNEVFHLPLIVWHPQWKKERIEHLTQNIDLLPTVMEYFDVPSTVPQLPIQGVSLLPMLYEEDYKGRDAVIYGYFGKSVNITDGRYTYLQAAGTEENRPLYLYTAMPTLLRLQAGMDGIHPEDYKKIEMGRHLPYTDYPVFKIPADIVDMPTTLRFDRRGEDNARSALYDMEKDYEQQHPVKDTALLGHYRKLLRETMEQYDSPAEQFERLGI